MKVSDVIERINKQKPNAYDNDDLMVFLNEFEAVVQSEVFGVPPENIKQYTWADDNDVELIIKLPYDLCYVYYVSSMIDLTNGEYTSYMNNNVMFNTYYDEFKKWYQREYGTSINTRVNMFD